MAKGWFFVLTSSYLIYLLLNKDVKKYNQVEDSLRQSQEQLLALMDVMPIALSWADERGNIQYSNNKFRELFGYAPEDIPTVKHWFQLAYPDQEYRNTVVSVWQTAVENARNSAPEMAPIEVSITCRDGSKREVAIIGTVLHDRILGIFNDLSQSKLAEKALRDSEKRYRTLFDSANDAILILQDNKFKECNQKTLEMFGCNREQIVGQTPYSFSPPQQPDGTDSAEKALEKIRKALNGQSDVFEWRHLRMNGEVFDAEISLSLIEIESQKFIQAIVRDISERKRLDRQLRLMQRWVEQNVDLFFWVAEDSRVLYVNQAACRSLGYTKEELSAMKVSDFDLDLPGEAWPDFAQKVRQQGSYRFETRHRKKNGQVFPVEITANILQFEGKSHFFAYGKDISDRVRADEKRKELENQLRQAQKMEAIGTLAGGIAHDFNNILSSIIGFTEISMREVPSESKLAENLQRVFNAGIRAGDLVRQILTFSRQTDHEITPLCIKPIARETLKLIRASLPATIDIRYDLRSDSLILADPTQVHQIIMNLCTNAGQAMQDTGGRLTVCLTEVELDAEATAPNPGMAPGPFVKLTVSDSGHGMAPEVKDRIFEPFFTTKEPGAGTGLGLSVVHGIVTDCGGMATVDSTPGEGSTFNIFFPKIESGQETEIEAHAPLLAGSERILFIDDEEPLADAGKKVLELLGYKVTAKTSSREALQVFRAKPDAFDLVVTDLTMPEMTGDVLAKKIMAIRSDIPVILCSGYSAKITPAKAKASGIKEVIMKPAVMAEIAAAVRRVLDKAAGN